MYKIFYLENTNYIIIELLCISVCTNSEPLQKDLFNRKIS